jgi:UDP-N-acetylmuramate--alanine ligase
VKLQDLGNVHIVGIGGAGMSGLARVLMARGVVVSGSDAKESRRLAAVRALGARVRVGHDVDIMLDQQGRCVVDTVVHSTAVGPSNVELVYAREHGLRVLSRAELLAAITDGARLVSVAGTHGKTTTTSMTVVAMQHCHVDPSFAIGSELNESGSNAHQGSGDIFVVEADESDGTFLVLDTHVGIVTNVEPDHLNYWKTVDAMERAFLVFADQIAERGGFLVACADDPGSAVVAAHGKARGADVRTYGFGDADYRIVLREHGERGWTFDIMGGGSVLAHISLQVPGKHNVLNATAAFVACVGLGLDPTAVAEGLSSFSGTSRRFDYKGSAGGVAVYDDYAHHPTEIAATLRAAREVVGEGRIIVAFQAHHFYRTAMFSREFGEALGLADEVVVLEVFAPGEEPIAGANGRTMAGNVPLPPEQVLFEPSWSAVPADLVARAKPGDIIMTLGAGEIGLLAPEILERLSEAHR